MYLFAGHGPAINRFDISSYFEVFMYLSAKQVFFKLSILGCQTTLWLLPNSVLWPSCFENNSTPRLNLGVDAQHALYIFIMKEGDLFFS